jgi:hypothetical protein
VAEAEHKPALQHILEAAAAAMDIGHGRQRLELVFLNGDLQRWWVHDENRAAADLRVFDQRAGWAAEVLAEHLVRRARESAG